MSGIIKRIQNWFELKLFQAVKPSLKDGFLVLDREQKTELALAKMVLEPWQSRLFGLFPILRVRKVGSFSFSDLVTHPIQAARDVFIAELNKTPAKVLALARKDFTVSTRDRIEVTRVVTNVAVRRLVEGFNEQHLRAFIRSDRNAFRQKLLEELGRQTSHIFAATTKKHIAELVMRVRQETSENVPDAPAAEKVTSIALPTGTRFFVKKGNMTAFVVEQQPQTRTLKIMDDDGVKSEMYRLSFPYVIFFITLRGRKSDKMYVFFRKKPLREMKDQLSCVALSNVYADFQVCFAPSASKDTLAEMAEESVNNFWGGRFVKTHDQANLTHQISIENWAAGTKKSALFGLSYNWRAANLSVGSMLDKIKDEFFTDTTGPGKTGRSGAAMMSALDGAVDTIAASITNSMKETCFNLVPSWTTDEVAIANVTARFRDIVAESCKLTHDKLGEEIDGILSEKALKEVFERAVEQTVKSMDADMSKPLAAARKAFLEELKSNSTKDTNDTDVC